MNQKNRAVLEKIIYEITFRESQLHASGRLMTILLQRLGYGRCGEFFLDILTPREQEIIKLRFGFLGDLPKSLDEVGEIYGFTKERIRQIESRALDKIADAIVKNTYLCTVCKKQLD